MSLASAIQRMLATIPKNMTTDTKWWNGKNQKFKEPGDYIPAEGVDSDCKKKMKALLSQLAKKQYLPVKEEFLSYGKLNITASQWFSLSFVHSNVHSLTLLLKFGMTPVMFLLKAWKVCYHLTNLKQYLLCDNIIMANLFFL